MACVGLFPVLICALSVKAKTFARGIVRRVYPRYESGLIGERMSEQSEEQALQQGHECAMSALASQTGKIASLGPGDRLYWWLGFLTAAMGAALASVGESAVRALRAALAEGPDPRTSTVRGKYIGSGIRLVKRGTYVAGEATRIKKKA
jgi:hypothetical protein